MMNKKNMKGLGRGLDALLAPRPHDNALEEKPIALSLKIDTLQPGHYQPRSHIDPEALNELAESIRHQGVLQPIIVRTLSENHYEILAGERRWRASQQAGLTHIPAIIRDVSNETALAIALIENLQRQDLNPLEKAHGIRRLIEEFEFTHQQAAEALGQSRTATTNLLRLLNLSHPVQILLQEHKLDMGHARTLLPLSASQQNKIAAEIVSKNLSVRDTERLVKHYTNPQTTTPREPTPHKNPYEAQQASLSKHLGTPIKIKHTQDSDQGLITIPFKNQQQLEVLLKQLLCQ